MRQGAWVALAATVGGYALGACTIESGGEQGPVYAGDGVVISDGEDGRTISIDPSVVPSLPNCNDGEIIQRTADGWICTTLGSGFESDPSVNDVGKLDLAACAEGDVVLQSGGAWACGSPLSSSSAETALAASATISALEQRVVDLESQLISIQYPVWLSDDFERSGTALGTPVLPQQTIYIQGNCGADVLGLADAGGQRGAQRIGASGTQVEARVVLQSPVRPWHMRVRMAFRLASLSTSYLELELDPCTAGACAAGCGKMIRVEIGSPTTGNIGLWNWGGMNPSVTSNNIAWSVSTTYFLEMIFDAGNVSFVVGTSGYGSSQIATQSFAFSSAFATPASANGIALRIQDADIPSHHVILDVDVRAIPPT